MKRIVLAAVVLAAWLAFAGPKAEAATRQVGIVNFAFKSGTCPPGGGNSITVNVGDTVTWTNCSSTAHTVTGNTFGDTVRLFNGDTVSHTFNAAGNFPYHCDVHGGMTGTVVVQSTSSTTTTTILNKKPIARYTVNKPTGARPLLIRVDASTSADPDGTIARYIWNWGDGTANSSGKLQSHTYQRVGTFTLRLTVVDNKGARGTTAKSIKVT
jgi:plastocyanin